ncbi:phosphoribosylglycinamide formyltransferase [Lacisediminimonas profundi]|uniref:phosphoribosylglycinamide formyltransferase n=1 Tax=Lacisediminimonas profundi TaxID=2603856 RepID=UPI00124B858F|nr:formyltransferase family protein [Lacisediminimonas profundi]
MEIARIKRIVFLCSGGGGNLRFVHKAIELGLIADAQIVAVLTDRDCPANAFATSVGIANRSIAFRDDGQRSLLAALDEHEPDLVITTVHKILHPSVVEKYRGRLINLHYSLLPAFGGEIGVRPVQAALAYGARFTGVTVHLVDETVDGGRPVVQAVIPTSPGDEDFDALMNLVFRCGCIALLMAIAVRLNGWPAFPGSSLQLMQRMCCFSAAVSLPGEVLSDEKFWQAIAATDIAGPGQA